MVLNNGNDALRVFSDNDEPNIELIEVGRPRKESNPTKNDRCAEKLLID